MQTVTYRGPVDPSDPTNEYVIGESVLPLGVPTPVPNEVAKLASDAEGHNFEVQSSKAAAKDTKQPAEGSNQED